MLRDAINTAVKEAMKARNERALSTLRMVNSTIKNADIDARGQGKPPLSDADLLSLLQKMIKQRQESVELYDKGGRTELAAQEREEIAIISAYLPKQMSDDEVKATYDWLRKYNILEDDVDISTIVDTSVTEEAMKITHEGFQLFGGNGTTREFPIEKLFRDVRSALIEDGENTTLTFRLGALAGKLYRNGWTRD